MPSNTGLTRDDAVRLLRGQPVSCPRCGREKLLPRYTYKNRNTEYKCPACKEIYHPVKLI